MYQPFPSHRLSVAQQAWILRHAFPRAECRMKCDRLVWRGNLTPSPLSETYKVEISYRLERSPRVRLVYPPLRTFKCQACRHLYSDDTLCLYDPRYGEWNAAMRISETIVPWASEWLFHYEIWLRTGQWHGGGDHPDPGMQKKTSKDINSTARRLRAARTGVSLHHLRN